MNKTIKFILTEIANPVTTIFETKETHAIASVDAGGWQTFFVTGVARWQRV